MLLPSYTLANDSDSLTDLGDELLYGLEIIDRDESPEGTVTRGQFADIFTKSNMLYSEDFVPSNPFSDTRESDYFTSIEILHNLGIVTGMSDNKFLPDEFMKTEDMLRLFINALGLEEYYRISGTTVLSAASELGLLKNVPYSDTLTIKNLMKVTYNFLTAPIGKYSLSDGKKLSIDNNDNVLHAKFKIEKITATVVENELSGIWAKSNLGKGCVKLKSDAGMIIANTHGTDISDYLGYTVDAFVEIDDENNVIVFEVKKGTKTLKIDISSINFGATDITKLAYENDKGTEKRVSFSNIPAIIYNGVYYDEGVFDFSKLENYEGYVTLISSSGNNTYDIVNITAYTDYYVDNVEYSNGDMYIYDSGNNPPLILGPDSANLSIYFPNGAEATPYEIQHGMLLTVTKSVDNQNVRVQISETAVEDVIVRYDSQYKTLQTSTAEYKVTSSCNSEDIKVGKKATIYIDCEGRVGWVETVENDGYTFAVLVKVIVETDGETAAVKVYESSSKFTILTLADKLKIDGVKYKDATSQGEALSNIKISGFLENTYPIRYKKNDSGQVTEIDTPYYNVGVESKDTLRIAINKATVLYTNDKIVGKSKVLKSTAKTFTIPGNANDAKYEEFYSTSGLSVGKNDNVVVLSTKDNSMYADVVVIMKEQSTYAPLNHDNKLFMVSNVNRVYDPITDEISLKLTGIESGSVKSYLIYSRLDKSQVEDLKEGDVVRLAFYNSRIHNIQKVFEVNEDSPDILGTYKQPGGANGVFDNECNYDMYHCGYVRKREGKYLEIWTASLTKKGARQEITKSTSWTNTDNSNEEYRVIQAVDIAVYDSSRPKGKRVYVGDLEDIPYYEGQGQYAFVIERYRSRTPKELMVIK